METGGRLTQRREWRRPVARKRREKQKSGRRAAALLFDRQELTPYCRILSRPWGELVVPRLDVTVRGNAGGMAGSGAPTSVMV